MNFPVPVEKVENVRSVLPLFILENRAAYELIFSYLQTHPCYIINMITKTHIFNELSDIKRVTHAVFG